MRETYNTQQTASMSPAGSARSKWFGRAAMGATVALGGLLTYVEVRSETASGDSLRAKSSLKSDLLLPTASWGSNALGPVDLLGQPIEELRAAISADSGDDFDGDGVHDDQEVLLGTKPFLFDSDGDGFGDGEELARQTDPSDDLSFPTADGISATLTARSGDIGQLRLVILLHEPASELGQSKLRIGALTANNTVSVPIQRFLGISNVLMSVGSEGSVVTTIDIPIQANFIHANEHVAFFLAAGNQELASFSAGAKIDVLSTDGTLMLLRPLAANTASIQSGGGSLRRPIPSPADPTPIPTTWVPGAVCFQRAITVGGNGAVVVKEIIEAACLQGFDTYCASSCSSSVGDTYRTIDPSAFIGG